VVPDRKPPRLCGDDRTVLLSLLAYQRESFVGKVAGVEDQAAEASPVTSGTSLLWLINHMADAEATWVLQRFAGQPADSGGGPPAGTVGAAVGRYVSVTGRVDSVIEGASLDAESTPFDEGPVVNLRWILAHLLEETARHAGHADILRELIDGSTGR
jgi:hypothetical protein